jgi:hypothetical protein
MLSKVEVIKKVKSLNFPENSYIVYGSAPFAVFGIREVNDIDLLVSKELYAKLKKSGWEKVYKGPKDEPVTYDIFEAHDTWEFSPYAPTLSELLSRAVKVEDVYFASLEDVRKWKVASGRPKDIKDLVLIDAYLKKKASL